MTVNGDPTSRARRPLDAAAICEPFAARIRATARAIGLASLVVAWTLVVLDGVTGRHPDRWEPSVEVALLCLASVGCFVAWRWEGVGGALMLIAAAGLGVLAATDYRPLASLLASLAFFVPAGLFLLCWQRTQSLRSIAAMLTVLALVLIVGGFASQRVHSYYFGPTHPESALEARPIDKVEWMWTGGVTDASAMVVAKLAHDDQDERLAVSEDASLLEAIYVPPEQVAEDGSRIVSFAVSGLRPGTEYFYAVEADGELESLRRGRFRTFPDEAASFTFAFGSCARTGSSGQVFDAIRELDPLFFLITGDFHYANIDENDPRRFREAYDEVLSSPAQAALYARTPIAYVWDDHDYGSNNADGLSPSREAARSVYRESVPHYPLPSEGAIYQAFTVGRVRFIVTDTRSERSPASAPDGAGKTMLGEEQKAWFKRELLAANALYPLIVWVNPDPWIDGPREGKDGWGGYATERRELADFISENDIRRLLMLSGDAHMLAIDDGTNSDYSTAQTGGFPVMHAAALDRRGSLKGGPYSEGAYPGGGQFGLVTVEDDGRSIEVTLSGRNWKNEEIVGYAYNVAAGQGEAAGVSGR